MISDFITQLRKAVNHMFVINTNTLKCAFQHLCYYFLLQVITEPLVKSIIHVNKSVIADIAQGKDMPPETSMIKVGLASH